MGMPFQGRSPHHRVAPDLDPVKASSVPSTRGTARLLEASEKPPLVAWLLVIVGHRHRIRQRARNQSNLPVTKDGQGFKIGLTLTRSMSVFVRADRVALGDYSPRAPTDPYVPALEHTVPQIMASLRA